LRNEAQGYIDTVRKNKSLTIIPSPIFLGQAEHLFLQQEATKLIETRAVRHSGGGFGSVRVAKGIRIGGYSGQSESSQEWRTLDTGRLMLTNEKIVFTGSKESRTIPMEKILAVETFRDSIRISVDGRAKSLKFPVSNPYIWGTVVNILKSVKDPLNLGDLKLDVA
jgi:hypothetical protein